MSVKQFRAWVEYAQLEPFGEERSDWRAGLVTSAIYNVNMDTRKHKPMEPADFMPKFNWHEHGDEEYANEADDGEDQPITLEQWNNFKSEIVMAAKPRN
jgi:hypothetical protein